LVPGIGYTDQEEARNERETSMGGRVRLLKAHIWATSRCVNRLFALMLQAADRAAREPSGSRAFTV